ncbi:MAG: hypothetical protein QM774_12835 [Gordonia sp. (in: high G+C Gram-positive bacteria)]|uniref:hypothetical protein n=1 Tax=Gordonia sp. (in: high G+C Gram-positive bacteria) TaxID=84139 RepID=UPI0039E49FE3
MIEPTGPLPDEVYWRRRLLAVAAGIAVVALVVGLIIWAGSGKKDSGTRNVASTGSASQTPTAPSTSAAPTTPVDAAAPATGSTPAPAESSDPAAPAPADASTSAAPAPAESDGTPACSDQALSVVVYTDKPTYTQGDQPEFTIVTTNGGLAPCSRDVGKAATNVVVRSLDGTRTLWAAQDCAPDKTVNHQVLAPGQQVTDKITWSGATSSPGCNKPRVAIPVGGYQAIAMNGQRESAPITFNVVKPAGQ